MSWGLTSKFRWLSVNHQLYPFLCFKPHFSKHWIPRCTVFGAKSDEIPDSETCLTSRWIWKSSEIPQKMLVLVESHLESPVVTILIGEKPFHPRPPCHSAVQKTFHPRPAMATRRRLARARCAGRCSTGSNGPTRCEENQLMIGESILMICDVN